MLTVLTAVDEGKGEPEAYEALLDAAQALASAEGDSAHEVHVPQQRAHGLTLYKRRAARKRPEDCGVFGPSNTGSLVSASSLLTGRKHEAKGKINTLHIEERAGE